MRTGTLVRVDVATSAGRRPEFTTDAQALGVHPFLAAPIGTSEPRLGALDLYSTSPEGSSGDDADLLSLVVDFAGRAVDDDTCLRGAQLEVEQLREAMTSRAPIEQASDAPALLRKQPQDTNTKLHTVAAQFLQVTTGTAAEPALDVPGGSGGSGAVS